MRLFIVLIAIGLSFVILSQSQAQIPGDVGTEECREEQLQIQEIIEMEAPYRNHGQLVKTAVHAVISAKKAKLITVKCAACIFIEFALGIPIEEQKTCGPDLEPEAETVACCLIGDVCEDLTPEDCDAKRGVPGVFGSQCSPFYCVSPN